MRWLLAEEHGAKDVVDHMVLEQFVAQILDGMAAWVQVTPSGGFQLSEDHLGAYLVVYPCPFLPALPIPVPQKQGPFPLKPVPRFQASLSPASVSSPPKVGGFKTPGVGVRPGPLCWCCREPRHFQDQFHVMEVGALVQIPNVPQATMLCYLVLQSFKFRVVHRPGAQIAVVDFLSRQGAGVGGRPDGSLA